MVRVHILCLNNECGGLRGMAALMGRQSATGKHMLELSENTAGEELGHFKISMSAALR